MRRAAATVLLGLFLCLCGLRFGVAGEDVKRRREFIVTEYLSPTAWKIKPKTQHLVEITPGGGIDFGTLFKNSEIDIAVLDGRQFIFAVQQQGGANYVRNTRKVVFDEAGQVMMDSAEIVQGYRATDRKAKLTVRGSNLPGSLCLRVESVEWGRDGVLSGSLRGLEVSSRDCSSGEASDSSVETVEGYNYLAVSPPREPRVFRIRFDSLFSATAQPVAITCEEDCRQMLRKGQLRQGVTVDECIKRICLGEKEEPKQQSEKPMEWAVTLLSTTNEGGRFQPVRSLPLSAIEATTQHHLMRITIRLKHLDGTAIVAGFVADATAGDAQGKRYKYVAAGPKGGLLFKRYLEGQQAMGLPASAEAEIDYIFSIPDGVDLVDFKWEDLGPIPLK